MIQQYDGTVQIDNVNLTNNKAFFRSSYSINSVKSGSLIQYSSFVSQSELNDEAFSYYRGEPFVVKQCNFIKNKAVNGNISRLIYLGSNSNMEVVECCFKENSCDYTFYSKSNSNITVKNCFCDETRTGADQNGTVKIESPISDSKTIAQGLIFLENCKNKDSYPKKFLCMHSNKLSEDISLLIVSYNCISSV